MSKLDVPPEAIESLRLACMLCETGAAIERYRHITFADNQVRAFNGIVSLQAPFPAENETFAVNEERLERALAACEGEGLSVSQTKDHLIFKQKKLTIRVRKLSADSVFSDRMVLPAKEDRFDASLLQNALGKVAPFVSADASRPWSVAALFQYGHAWATNNLALVRSPIALDVELKIPSPAIPVLLALPSIEWVAKDEHKVFVAHKRVVLSFPEHQGDWPDVRAFFKDKPKKLEPLDSELLDAAKMVEKFADRFVTLSPGAIEGKTATIESEYEVSVKKGCGTYSAKLLSLVLSVASHGDFSTYPKPVFFAGEGIEGVAVGVTPEQAAA